ncbi:hypothetical protein HY497_00705 [Candidatus Woesearchaeota archaeon]|nr:hypothetical protein [Candidatus Woesearchaeota archaeon]
MIMMAEQETTDYFTQKRIEMMVEIASKKVVSEVQLLRKMVMQLEQELVELRQKMNSRPVQQPIQQPVQPPVQQQIKTERKPSQDAPRYGDYTSEDVSIEKMFNFSGKKV